MGTMSDKPWDLQKAEKYKDHDLVVSDISPSDMANIKGIAIRNFVDTATADAAALTIDAFMGYLKQKGFRIIKERK